MVGYDAGGPAMLLARKSPERAGGRFFFDFVYPGIGPRMGAPDGPSATSPRKRGRC